MTTRLKTPIPLRSISTTWKLERPEMPLTESTTSPGTRPAVSAFEPTSTFLMIGCTDEPSTLKKDLSKASSERWKTAPILVSSYSLISRTSRRAGMPVGRVGACPFPLATAPLAAPPAGPLIDEVRFFPLAKSFSRLSPFLAPAAAVLDPRSLAMRSLWLDDQSTELTTSMNRLKLRRLSSTATILSPTLSWPATGPPDSTSTTVFIGSMPKPRRPVLGSREMTMSSSSIRRGVAPTCAPSFLARSRRGDLGCVDMRE
mmetsp:Transcript_25412/g.54903  ORF Transcript_25412/g.54903 Transcript_25412/m.54903 type:complete len:258 (+) Transcript_25412:96-869(+)